MAAKLPAVEVSSIAENIRLVPASSDKLPADAARLVLSFPVSPIPKTSSKSKSAVKPGVVARLNRSNEYVGALLPIVTDPKSCTSAVTVERRHGLKDYGRSAFAAFAEGGLYGQPLPWEADLEGYFQAGVVDFNNPLWFVDGQLVATRPLWRNLSAGFGTWAGAQPGLRRLDVGPRVSLKVGRGMRAHADYRLNVAGNAQPGSGATITLAGDF